MSDEKTVQFVSADPSMRSVQIDLLDESVKPFKRYKVIFSPIAGTKLGTTTFNLDPDVDEHGKKKLDLFEKALKKMPLSASGIRRFDPDIDEAWETRLRRAAGNLQWITDLLAYHGFKVDLDHKEIHTPDSSGLGVIRSRDIPKVPEVSPESDVSSKTVEPDEPTADTIAKLKKAVVEYREANPNANWPDVWKAIPNMYTNWQGLRMAMRHQGII